MSSAGPVVNDREARVRIPALDGIRGLAIALVLLWHQFIAPWHPLPGSIGAYATRFTSLLWMGVDLFFVLSGFLVTTVLLESQGRRGYFTSFYVRRFFRIIPAYAVLLLAFVLARESALSEGPAGKWMFAQSPSLWSCLIFWQNQVMVAQNAHGGQFLAPTWSLAVEEQFYLLLPLLIYFHSGRKLLMVMCCLLGLGWLTKAAFHLQGTSSLAVWLPLPCRLDALMAGALGAAWLRQPDWLSWHALLKRYHATLVGITIACFFIGSLLLPVVGWTALACGGATILALLFALVIVSAVCAAESDYRGWLCAKPLVWLGTISYGVYLFHQPINGWLHAWVLHAAPSVDGWKAGLTTTAALGLTLLFCSASWRWFERPLIGLGRRLTGSVATPTV